MKIRHVAVATMLGFAAWSSTAQDFRAGSIKISHPFARETTAGQPTGGAFMTIVNDGENDRLLSASAPVAKSVELHQMQLQGDVMKMRQVDGIDIGGGTTVELKPGGYHVMFVGLIAPLVAGTRFPMMLNFQKAGAVSVNVTVESPGAETLHQRASVSARGPEAPT